MIVREKTAGNHTVYRIMGTKHWKFERFKKQGVSLHLGRNVSFHTYRRMRAARFSKEWHNHNGTRYFAFGWASPTVHRWWACSNIIYLTKRG